MARRPCYLLPHAVSGHHFITNAGSPCPTPRGGCAAVLLLLSDQQQPVTPMSRNSTPAFFLCPRPQGSSSSSSLASISPASDPLLGSLSPAASSGFLYADTELRSPDPRRRVGVWTAPCCVVDLHGSTVSASCFAGSAQRRRAVVETRGENPPPPPLSSLFFSVCNVRWSVANKCVCFHS
jgi:hypothetical protein